jgi:hypothetical protein
MLTSLCRKFALIGILLLPTASLADTIQDSIVAQLTQQGFHRIEVSRTLLGRIRILAFSDALEREIVFNPATGEILRDYWHDRDDDTPDRTPRLVDPTDRGGDDHGGGVDGTDDGNDDGDDVDDNSDGDDNGDRGDDGRDDDRDDEDDDDEEDDDDDGRDDRRDDN